MKYKTDYWYSCDIVGYVAAFPIIQEGTIDIGEIAVHDVIDQYVDHLNSKRSDVVFDPDVLQYNLGSFGEGPGYETLATSALAVAQMFAKLMSSQGLFVYGAVCVGKKYVNPGVYFRISRPTVPIGLDDIRDLNPRVAALLERKHLNVKYEACKVLRTG